MQRLTVLLTILLLTLTGCIEKNDPELSVVTIPKQTSVDIIFGNININDYHLTKIEIYEVNTLIETITPRSDFSRVSVENLSSSMTHKIIVKYEDEFEFEYQEVVYFNTLAYEVPVMRVVNITQEVGNISFEIEKNDPYDLIEVKSFGLYNDEGLVFELDKDNTYFSFENLDLNKRYFVEIEMEYDLQTETGLINRLYQCEIYVYDKTITLFNELALRTSIQEGFQIIKWDQDIKIHITGNPSDALIDETEKIADELTTLMNGISVSVVNTESEANVHLYFGNQAYFQTLLPKATGFQPDIWGHAVAYTNDDYIIDQGYILVNLTDLPNEEEAKSTLRHELMHIVGCFGHTGWDKESSLYIGEPVPPTLEFSETDKQIIQLLYMDRIVVGMHQQTVDNILLEELY